MFINLRKSGNVRKNAVAGNIIWNTAGNIFYLGCQWLLSVAVVRISGSYTDVGVLSLAISLTNIFTILAMFNVRSYQVSDIRGKYSALEYIFHRILTAFIAIVLCIIFTVLNRYSPSTTLSIVAYMLIRSVEAVADVFHGILQTQWRLDIVGRSAIFRGIALIGSFTITYKRSGVLSLSLFTSSALMTILFFLYDFRIVVRTSALSCTFQRKNLLNISRECMPLLGYALCSNLIIPTARFFIERYHGEQLLGYYGSVSTIAVIVQAVALYIFNPLNKVISEYYAQGNRRAILTLSGKILLALAILTGVTLVGSRLFGKFVLVFLFGESIAPYAYLLGPAVVISCLAGLTWFLGLLLTIMRSMKILSIGAAAGFSLSVLLSLVLIPTFCFQGANISVIAAFSITVGIYTLAVIKNFLNTDTD